MDQVKVQKEMGTEEMDRVKVQKEMDRVNVQRWLGFWKGSFLLAFVGVLVAFFQSHFCMEQLQFKMSAVEVFSPKTHNLTHYYCVEAQNISQTTYGNLVTAFIISSPRHEDNTPAHEYGANASSRALEVLQSVVRSLFETLHLSGARVVVMFDGRNPKTTDDHWKKYQCKINDFKAWIYGNASFSTVEIFENPEWQHAANTWKTVWNLPNKHPTTPIVFQVQDDSLVFGTIEVGLILRNLLCDPEVDYVKFFWRMECDKWEALPCEPHHSGMLHSISSYSDRPHFATTEFYDNNIFPNIRPTFRGVPEDAFRRAPKIQGMWMYGRRGNMKHDSNVLNSSICKTATPSSCF